MGQKTHYVRYFLKNVPASICERLFHKGRPTDKFCGKRNLTVAKGGSLIRQFIEAGKPFACIRFGGSEISCLNGHEKIKLGFAKTYKESARWAMKVRAGFYPIGDGHLNEFTDLYEAKIKDADIFGVLGLHMEDYFYKKDIPQTQVINAFAIEPLLGGWTPALKGKKVLVITSFADEVVFQYARREKLFPHDPGLLPEFELHVLQAPMTLGDDTDYRFPSFMRSLEEIETKIGTIDFDIALIGCGAYGTLLTMYCKSLGKMAIQTGGSTQTLFGIIGHRWENREHVKSRINEYWIRPAHKPKGYEKIDNGAYW
jgi:hypothetical protein